MVFVGTQAQWLRACFKHHCIVSERLEVKMILIVCVNDDPISCFLTHSSLNAIPDVLSVVRKHSLTFCSFLLTFSGSLCQTGGSLSSLSVRGLRPLPFSLCRSPFVSLAHALCDMCAHTHATNHISRFVTSV